MTSLKNMVYGSTEIDNRELIVKYRLLTIFTIILLSSLILQTTGFSTAGAYAVISVVYLFAGLIFLFEGKNRIQMKRIYLATFLVFVLVVFLRTITNLTAFDVVRLVALLTFTSANFYLIPSLIDFDRFLHITSRIGAIVVLIGLLPYFGFPTKIGFLDISFWEPFSRVNYGEQWRSFFENTASGIYVLTSVFVNPNQLGGLSLVGAIAALGEWRRSKSYFIIPIILINTLGLVLSRYRAGWFAFLAAVGLYFAYRIAGRKGLLFATVGGISAIGLILSMMFSLIPSPEVLTEITLGDRRKLWAASIRELENRPLLGHGFLGVQEIVGNPHNSYLRIFAGFGVIGGMSYLLLVVGTAIGSARRTVSSRGLSLTMLLVALLIMQITNQLSFVGVSMRSSFISIFMGYYISTDNDF
jgi:O-antigen ligase